MTAQPQNHQLQEKPQEAQGIALMVGLLLTLMLLTFLLA